MNNRNQKSELTGSPNVSRTYQEYSRILTAAVINNQFRKLLLSNPGKAIESGYAGERFYLAREEKKRVSEIKASSLADFASQLSQVLDYSQVAASAGD
jgi:hypothetical protein